MPELESRISAQVVSRGSNTPQGRLGEALVESAGENLRALVFFGSRRSGARTDAWSAFDMFVIVRSPLQFYRALVARGQLHRPAGLMAVLGRCLAPNQVSFQLADGHETLRAKLAVLSESQFRRETSPRRRDHFCVARLFQPVEVVRTADAEAQALVLDGLAGAHRATFAWARAALQERFDIDGYTRRLLEVSLGTEIRPESGSRARQLWEAQQAYHRQVYPAVLAERVAQGDLTEVAPGEFMPKSVSAGARLSVRIYFWRSLLRATLRWGKHVLTFDGWLDYLVRKAERHTGRPIQLSPREKRWPLIFLWPRTVRYLRDRPPARKE